MFDLEKAIGRWRQQMLAAGISVLALDELESHLREEIELRKLSGSSESEAFSVGVQEIGHGEALTLEFKKVEANDPIEAAKNSLIQVIGWIAAGCILILGFMGLEMSWDLWGFKPKWNLSVLCAIFQVLVAVIGIWFLATVNRDRTSRVVSLLICLFLGWFAVLNYHHQMYPRGILGGSLEPNPSWYRWGTTLLLLMPAAFWISARWPACWKKHRPIAPATITAERIFSGITAFYIISISVWFFRIGDGATYFFAPVAVLLAVLLVVYGCLAVGRLEKRSRGRRLIE